MLRWLGVLASVAILAAVAIYCALPHPIQDQARLKAIAAEARALMIAHPVGAMQVPVRVPREEWPPTIAGLRPEWVTVFDGKVDILIKPYFDGGWGYGFATDRRRLGMLDECWSPLGHDLYWHGPCYMHPGSCHCGRIRLTLRDAPVEAAECNCLICRRTAGLWHYCSADAATVEGEPVAYRQGDRALDLWHCPVCGCTTHWTPTDPSYPRMGINLRMFEPVLWRDLSRRMVDGARF